MPRTPPALGNRAYDNPIIPGCYPDPSVCRVGADYYLVTSTFEYFPGVPIFHSRDLSTWRQIGHALTRDSQLELRGCRSSQGIFAPTIRHHDGTFYVVTSNMSGAGNFVVSASDPAASWSEPVWLDREGMDPSLFFDDDGAVYYTRHADGERGVIVQARLDLAAGRLLEELRPIWRGTGGIWPEGPHLYKIEGRYYLLISEGGTSYDHRVTVARSDSPWGPFEANPSNPILTHAGLGADPIQATGHADLVQAADGSWWLVFLGIRPSVRHHHHLGRETFLAPVTWHHGWPVVNNGQPIASRIVSDRLPPQAASANEPPSGVAPARDDFRSGQLPPHACYVRNPTRSAYTLSERPGMLRLHASNTSMNDVGSPTFLGRRQQHFEVRIRTEMEFEPTASGQAAGLVLRMNEDHHYDLLVTLVDGHLRAELRSTLAGVTRVLASGPVAAGPVQLIVDATRDDYRFSYGPPSDAATSLGEAPSLPLSTELAGGFTGVVAGLHAYTPDEPCWADFAFFELEPA